MWKLVLGLNALLCQGFFYFMLVAFSMPGNREIRGLDKFLTASFFGLTAVCFLAAVLLLLGYFRHWAIVYSWIFLPIPFAVAFVLIRFTAFKP